MLGQARVRVIELRNDLKAIMDQIALAMQNIEQASTQSVAATEQVERAAADLNQLAQRLSETIRGATGKDNGVVTRRA